MMKKDSSTLYKVSSIDKYAEVIHQIEGNFVSTGCVNNSHTLTGLILKKTSLEIQNLTQEYYILRNTVEAVYEDFRISERPDRESE